MLISLPDAAERLGVDESRVRQRIADGSLRAEKIGGRWLIDDADLASISEHRPGRPLSALSAWAMVVAAAEQPGAANRSDPAAKELLAGLPHPVRARARSRLHACQRKAQRARVVGGERPVAEVAAELRQLLRGRAARTLYRASRLDLDDLRNDPRLVRSGLSHPRSGISSGSVVEGYVPHDAVPDLERRYLLERARGREANVFLHVLPDHGCQPGLDPLISQGLSLDSWLVLAADLAEHRGPREEARALELLAAGGEETSR